jgi:hypothetical protein
LIGITGKVDFGDGNRLVLPDMVKLRQKFQSPRVSDISAAISGGFKPCSVHDVIKPGMKVAVCVGSRGVRNLQTIVACVVKELKIRGAEPFIVPAMGSHGGATAEGQIHVMETYGITEDNIGVPIIASMETVVIAELEGIPIHCDKHAFESDAIVLINRVKPHTDFKGEIESGLCKMAVIGLGKHRGASLLHRQGFDEFHRVIPAAAKLVLDKAPIAVGVAVVENAFDETAYIEVLPAKSIPEEEKRLLQMAKSLMPRLMFDRIDVLVVDEIGKDISGAGMDPNITGRTVSGLREGFSVLPIQKIVVLDLTEKTAGNACGVGVADVITRRLLDKIDFPATYANTITLTVLDGGKIPMIMNSDWDALALALKTCYRISPQMAKIVRIKNTLELEEIEVSQPCLNGLAANAKVEVLSEPYPWEFDEQGNYKRLGRMP